jgi:hypothetical protein
VGSATTGQTFGPPSEQARNGQRSLIRIRTVTTLRAAVIVGRGGAAFETIVALVDRLPVMVAPR